MRAVLEEALVELAAERVELTSSLPDDQHRRELLNWFASRDRSWPCSFENVCDAIDLDPARLRGLLGTGCGPVASDRSRAHLAGRNVTFR